MGEATVFLLRAVVLLSTCAHGARASLLVRRINPVHAIAYGYSPPLWKPLRPLQPKPAAAEEVNSARAARCRAASTVHRGRTDRSNQLRLRRLSSRTQAHSRYHSYYCLRYGQELVKVEVAIQGRKIFTEVSIWHCQAMALRP